MNEISLVIQSVCVEAAVGIMLFLALGRLRNKALHGKTAGIFAAVLAALGVVSSITHLGQPLRAFNSLLNIGSSWMSRETVLVALFTACCAVYAVLALWRPAPKAVLRVLEWASAIIGLALLFSMASIYNFASVPFWKGANTYIEYYTTAIILGAMFYFALTCKQQQSGRILGAVTLAVLAVQIVSSELHTVALTASGSTAAAASAEILSSNSVLVAVKWILLFAGVGVFLLKSARVAAPELATVTADGPQKAAEEATVATGDQAAWISVCAVFVAAIIGKVLFFSSMVVSGVGMQ